MKSKVDDDQSVKGRSFRAVKCQSCKVAVLESAGCEEAKVNLRMIDRMKENLTIIKPKTKLVLDGFVNKQEEKVYGLKETPRACNGVQIVAVFKDLVSIFLGVGFLHIKCSCGPVLFSPESGLGSVVVIGREQVVGSLVVILLLLLLIIIIIPSLVDVLVDDKGLGVGFSVVDEDGDFFVNGVHLEEQGALVPQVLLLVCELDPHLSERDLAPHPKHAGPEVQQGHFFLPRRH
ncbi:hypothetical protein CRG98_030471, partial [Punica granatum]